MVNGTIRLPDEPAITSVDNADLLYVEQFQGGSDYLSKKITFANLSASFNFAPVTVQQALFLTLATSSALVNERVLTLGSTFTAVDGGAGSTYTITTNAFTGDVTTAANSFSTTIANSAITSVKIATNAVDNTKFRQSSGLSVVGRSANSTGDVADIIAASDNYVLRRSGTSIGFGTIDASIIANGSVSNTEFQYLDGVTSNIQTQLDAKGTGTVTSVSGTSNRITVATGTTTPVIDISASYVGQTSITTLGTVSTGTWSATTIAVNKGGTGQTSYTNGQLLIGNTSGNTLTKATLTAGTNITITNGNGSIEIAASGGGTPGGSNTQVQYNNAGSFGGITGATTNGTALTLAAPILGTPASGTLTNCTGLPVSTGISGLGTGIATFLATPSSANLAAAVTGETGSGALVFATSPTLVTPILGVASATSITVGNTGLVVGSSTPFSDSSGTLTLQNVDALDATTESTIEAAIDTLVNLTSIQNQTISLSAPLTIPADPNADRILFWDDSGGGTTWLTVGSGLSITGTTISATGGGGGTPGGSDTQIQYNNAGSFGGDPNFNWDYTNLVFNAGDIMSGATGAQFLVDGSAGNQISGATASNDTSLLLNANTFTIKAPQFVFGNAADTTVFIVSDTLGFFTSGLNPSATDKLVTVDSAGQLGAAGGSQILASNFTTSNTAAQNTPLTFAIAANESYFMTIVGTAQKATSNTGLKLAIGAPSGCTLKGWAELGGLTFTTALTISSMTAVNSLGATFATGTGVEVPFRLQFSIINGANAGSITFQAATVTSNTLTIFAGTEMIYVKGSAL